MWFTVEPPVIIVIHGLIGLPFFSYIRNIHSCTAKGHIHLDWLMWHPSLPSQTPWLTNRTVINDENWVIKLRCLSDSALQCGADAQDAYVWHLYLIVLFNRCCDKVTRGIRSSDGYCQGRSGTDSSDTTRPCAQLFRFLLRDHQQLGQCVQAR